MWLKEVPTKGHNSHKVGYRALDQFKRFVNTIGSSSGPLTNCNKELYYFLLADISHFGYFMELLSTLVEIFGINNNKFTLPLFRIPYIFFIFLFFIFFIFLLNNNKNRFFKTTSIG